MLSPGIRVSIAQASTPNNPPPITASAPSRHLRAGLDSSGGNLGSRFNASNSSRIVTTSTEICVSARSGAEKRTNARLITSPITLI